MPDAEFHIYGEGPAKPSLMANGPFAASHPTKSSANSGPTTQTVLHSTQSTKYRDETPRTAATNFVLAKIGALSTYIC
jgi:hypothetical protein